MGVPIQKCAGCGAEIYWIKSMKGRAMPVDTKKVSIITPEGSVVSGYTSHFATCPKADDFRTTKKAEKPAKS